MIELYVNSKRADSLLRTNVDSYGDPYKAYADTEYYKRRLHDQKKVMEEIKRRNSIEYNV